ncbi:hypothetical protein CR513_09767, partial [Mucuna pruriens]
MGEKELVITTPAPEEYIEGDEEALEAFFQSLEVEGTNRGKPKSTTSTPSRNIALQARDWAPTWKAYRPRSWYKKTQDDLDSTIEEMTQGGAKPYPKRRPKNNPISPIDSQSLGNEEPNRPSEPSENVSTEAEALVDIERWIDREKSKFEAPMKDLESVNLGEGIKGREVWIGKQIPPDLRAKLIKLLKEYADVFAWSYQDMPGLDREIVEHKLHLLPGSTLVR